MDRNELITCLIEQPRAIHAAEAALLEIEESRRQLCHQIENQEAELLLTGTARQSRNQKEASGKAKSSRPPQNLSVSSTVDGRNAELRTAQLRELTASQRALLIETDRRAAAAKLTLHRRQNEFAALRAIARVLGSAE